MLEELIQLDQKTFLYLNNLGTETWDTFWLIITNKYTWTPLYIAIIVFYFIKNSYKQAALLVLSAILLAATVNEVTDLLKYGLERLRPCHNPLINDWVRIVGDSCSGKFSFTSGHAGNHMALAVYFYHTAFRKYKFGKLFIIWAILIGYSRIYVGVHFPLDIIGGFIIGISFATIYYRLIQLISIKYKHFLD